MRRSLLPLAVVMLPQMALAILQLGVPVLAPAFIGEAGLAPETVGLVAGCIGLGSVWMFAANAAVTPVLGPLKALVWACLLALAGVAALALFPLVAFGLLSIAPGAYNGGVVPGRVRIGSLANPRVLLEPFRTLREMPQLRPTALASIGFATVQGSLFAFFTTYMTDGLGLGLALALAGTLFATMQVASVSGRLGAGLLADWVGGSAPVLKGMSLAGGTAMLIMAAVGSDWPTWTLFVVAACAGAAATTWNGLFLAEIARLSPPDEVGRATAGTTFFTFVAYMSAPPLFGGVAHVAGYEVAYCLSACASLATFTVLARADRG